MRKTRKRGTLSNCGKRSKYLTTILGDITYQKHLYQDKEGYYHYLLDETIGLKPNQRTSINYQKTAGLFSFIAGSYRNAEEFLLQCFGDSLSFESIRQQVQNQGKQILKQEEQAFDRKLGEALKATTVKPITTQEEALYLEADGTIIHLQQQEQKQAELKLAILHKGKEKRYPSGTSKAKKLKDRWAYANLCLGDQFMAKVSLLAEENFQLDAHRLILVGGDGVSWIKQGARDYFPSAIYQLCPFHLERKLTQTLSFNQKNRVRSGYCYSKEKSQKP